MIGFIYIFAAVELTAGILMWGLTGWFLWLAVVLLFGRGLVAIEEQHKQQK